MNNIKHYSSFTKLSTKKVSRHNYTGKISHSHVGNYTLKEFHEG